jgi:LasA protease
MRIFPAICLIMSIFVSSCSRTPTVKAQDTPAAVTPIANPSLPTSVPIQTYLPPTRSAGTPIFSPTPNGGVVAFPTFTDIPNSVVLTPEKSPIPGQQDYTVQDGDFPSSIAEKFGITTDELLNANNLGSDAIIYPGDTLIIPVESTPNVPVGEVTPQSVSSSDYFKILPDSELVYGPLSALLDVNAYVQKEGGYLAFYTQDITGATLTGAQIVTKVAQDYSVNPRLLLAMLEYRSQWVTNPNPAPSTTYTPIGYVDDFHQGLYRQLTWTADMLNQGFYQWKQGKVQTWTLADGSDVVPQPGINPGTAGVQHAFAKLDSQDTWAIDTGPNGLYATFTKMFGYPFDLAIEPLLPEGLTQPTLSLPFEAGQVWQFTGGPHAGWDQGSAWAALDFAPPGDPIGCGASEAWVVAAAPGLIVRADTGAVMEDLDGDGLEETGWNILYMHMEARDRVQPGTYVQTGDRIGHPSCEGGLADADHLHMARRYNGVWIPAGDPTVPFVMDGYVTTGTEVEYDGWLKGNGKVIEAWNGKNTINEIQK